MGPRKIWPLAPPRRRWTNHHGQFTLARGAHSFRAAEFLEQLLHRLLAHALNRVELAGELSRVAQRAVEGHGEAVSFVTNRLHQAQHGRKTFPNHPLAPPPLHAHNPPPPPTP